MTTCERYAELDAAERYVAGRMTAAKPRTSSSISSPATRAWPPCGASKTCGTSWPSGERRLDAGRSTRSAGPPPRQRELPHRRGRGRRGRRLRRLRRRLRWSWASTGCAAAHHHHRPARPGGACLNRAVRGARRAASASFRAFARQRQPSSAAVAAAVAVRRTYAGTRGAHHADRPSRHRHSTAVRGGARAW